MTTGVLEVVGVVFSDGEDKWSWKFKHDDDFSAKGEVAAKEREVDRSFRIVRSMINFVGTDLVTFRAENETTGEVCVRRAQPTERMTDVRVRDPLEVTRRASAPQPGHPVPADRRADRRRRRRGQQLPGRPSRPRRSHRGGSSAPPRCWPRRWPSRRCPRDIVEAATARCGRPDRPQRACRALLDVDQVDRVTISRRQRSDRLLRRVRALIGKTRPSWTPTICAC